MMAEVGGIVKVSGSRMATPLAPPSPGSTPITVPRRMPTTATNRLNGVTAISNLKKRFSNPTASVPQPGLERPLRHGHEEPSLENEKRDHGHRDGDDGDGRPPVPADPAHVDGDVEGRGDVEAETVGRTRRVGHGDEGRDGNDHLEDGDQLLAAGEDLGRPPSPGLHEDGGGEEYEEGRQPEREESAARPLLPPADAELDGVVDDDAAQGDQHHGGDEIAGAHPTSW